MGLVASALVTSVLILPNGQALEIQANEASQDLKNNLSSWTGEVVTTQGPYRLTSERLEVHYRDGQPCIIVVEGQLIEGNGLIAGKPTTLSGEHILYDCNAAEALLEGQAHVSQGPNQLSAHLILYNFLEDHLEARSAQANRVKLQLEP